MNRFKIRFKRRSIFDIETEPSYTTRSVFFEWLEVAKFCNYPVLDFFKLNSSEQSLLVAFYRASLQLQAVHAKDQKDKAERESRNR